ncbi:2-oxo acid dehydrogenase subunit E2 [candidate division KSB1 bacterium]|nr:2-oxo acid dehydrogenase subunit E2 [candidate division KSB1 bacterium]
MVTPINMPQVGQDIETAVVTEWKVKSGDKIKVGDVIALVESDKAVFEVEAYAAGTITEIVVEEGEEGKVFEPMAYMRTEKETLVEGERSDEQGEGRKEEGDRRPKTGDRDKEDIEQSTFSVPHSTHRPFASPSARRLARQHDIDLSTLAGSGPNGRIVKKDILKAFEQSAIGHQPSAKDEEMKADSRQPNTQSLQSAVEDKDHAIPFTKIRQTIADRMTRSATTIPHFYLCIHADMTAALAWRESYNVTAVEKISINDMLIRAVVHSLKKFPRMNAHVESDKLIAKKDINIGVAVSLGEGLIVPVIPRADALSLDEIHVAAKNAALQAKSGVMKITDPGTFTISNLGMFGVHQFTPIINPPEAGILGVGAVEKQFVPGPNNSFAVREKIKLTLACDHRAIDGAYAAEFLNSMRSFLEKFE